MIDRIQVHFTIEFYSIETIGQLSSSPRIAARTAMKKKGMKCSLEYTWT